MLSSKQAHLKRKKGRADDPINLDSDSDDPSSKRIKSGDSASQTSPRSTQPIKPGIADSTGGSSDPFSSQQSRSSLSASVSSSPTSANSHNNPPYLELGQLLSSLDGVSRESHMSELAQKLQAARDTLKAFEPEVTRSQQAHASIKTQHQDQRKLYNEMMILHADTSEDELQLLRDMVDTLGVAVVWHKDQLQHARETRRLYREIVLARGTFRETWTQLWDVYERMTMPGPSSEPPTVRQLWDSGYSAQLTTALQKARADLEEATEGLSESTGPLIESDRDGL